MPFNDETSCFTSRGQEMTWYRSLLWLDSIFFDYCIKFGPVLDFPDHA